MSLSEGRSLLKKAKQPIVLVISATKPSVTIIRCGW